MVQDLLDGLVFLQIIVAELLVGQERQFAFDLSGPARVFALVDGGKLLLEQVDFGLVVE